MPNTPDPSAPVAPQAQARRIIGEWLNEPDEDSEKSQPDLCRAIAQAIAQQRRQAFVDAVSIVRKAQHSHLAQSYIEIVLSKIIADLDQHAAQEEQG